MVGAKPLEPAADLVEAVFRNGLSLQASINAKVNLTFLVVNGSSTADFEEMIIKNNLKIIDCFSFDDPIYEPIYYIEIGHA